MSAASAQAAFIRFTDTTDLIQATGPSYIESGYQITFTGATYFIDNSFNTAELGAFDGDVLMFDDALGASILITKVGGGLFDFLSVQFGKAFNTPSDLKFTGNLDGGGTVEQTFPASTFLNVTGPIFQSFSGFTGLTSLSVSSVSGQRPVMDNFELVDTAPPTATPEPASMALLCMGGGLLAFGRNKLRRRQAA